MRCNGRTRSVRGSGTARARRTGSSHTYRFVLHALNQKVDEVTDDTPVDDLLEVIDAFTLGSTTITGTFTR